MLCALCERDVPFTRRHHLIPRARHRNRRNKREFDRVEVKKTVRICKPCHKQIHSIFTPKELEREYRTVEALKAHPGMDKFIQWVKKRNAEFQVRTKQGK